jgi:hypothetical protein
MCDAAKAILLAPVIVVEMLEFLSLFALTAYAESYRRAMR